MSVSSTTDRAAALGPLTRGFIGAEWLAGRNTCEIGRVLSMPEAVVAEVVRAERERRGPARVGREQ